MLVQKGLLGSALLGVIALAACGGSSNDGGGTATAGSGTAAGSSGASGSSSSAGSGAGGSSSSGGGRGGTSPSSGGSRADGGTGTGGFNIGGFNPSDFACETPPTVGDECDQETTVPCLNGTSVCYCDEMSEWACQSVIGGGGAGGLGGTGPIGDVDCPETKPMNGAACGDSIGFCPYPGGAFGGCACYRGSWACL